MFGIPFTISQLAGEFDPNDRRESKSIAQYLRYLARTLVKGGVLESGWIFDEEWELPDNAVLNNTQFFYDPFYHSREDIREFVMKEYTDYAKNIGKRKKKKKERTQRHDKNTCFYCGKICKSPMVGYIEIHEGKSWMCHKDCVGNK